MRVADTRPDGVRYLTTREVLQRYSASRMWLWRALHNPNSGFPQPVKLGGHPRATRRWLLSDLEEWEAKQRDRTKKADGGEAILKSRECALG